MSARTLERLRPHLATLWAAALAVAALAEIWIAPVPGSRDVVVPATLGWTLPLLFAGVAPLLAGLLPPAAFLGEGLASYPSTENTLFLLVALVWALWLLGSLSNRRLALVAGLVGVALLVATVAVNPSGVGGGDILFAIIIGVAPWVAGLAMRRRSDRAAGFEDLAVWLEREHEAGILAAAAEERTRIAQDLHAIIAGAIEAMTVQAASARLLVRTDTARAGEAVLAVEETGREALAEMRRLLGVLRTPRLELELEPQPGVESLPLLASRLSIGELSVEVRNEGEPYPLPMGLDLMAYRVAEQALALACKHSGATSAVLTLSWSRDGLELAVVDDGEPRNGRWEDSQEVAAIRARVVPFGGSLESADHGRRLVARLPLEEVLT